MRKRALREYDVRNEDIIPTEDDICRYEQLRREKAITADDMMILLRAAVIKQRVYMVGFRNRLNVSVEITYPALKEY